MVPWYPDFRLQTNFSLLGISCQLYERKLRKLMFPGNFEKQSYELELTTAFETGKRSSNREILLCHYPLSVLIQRKHKTNVNFERLIGAFFLLLWKTI